jgi:hypothetical protein
MLLRPQFNDLDCSEQELRLLDRINRFGCNNGNGRVLWHPDSMRVNASSIRDRHTFCYHAAVNDGGVFVGHSSILFLVPVILVMLLTELDSLTASSMSLVCRPERSM